MGCLHQVQTHAGSYGTSLKVNALAEVEVGKVNRGYIICISKNLEKAAST